MKRQTRLQPQVLPACLSRTQPPGRGACSSPAYWGKGLYVGAAYPLSKASCRAQHFPPSLWTLLLSSPLLSFLLCLQLLSYTKTRSVLYERFHCHNLPGKRQPSTGSRKAHLRNKQTDRQKNSWMVLDQASGTPVWEHLLGLPNPRGHERENTASTPYHKIWLLSSQKQRLWAQEKHTRARKHTHTSS